MPERPLLILPAPERIDPPNRTGRGPQLRLPGRPSQIGRFGPLFGRLSQVLSRGDGALELRTDPSSLAPDRVIVFEIAGTVKDFADAVARIPGLEFMSEHESEFPADDEFAVMDTRTGREGLIRPDREVSSRLYLAMPDVRALNELISLWERWERGERLGHGFAPFSGLFRQLHAIRPWGPLDRIPEETIEFWQEEAARHPDRPVRTEVDLWFHQGEARRRRASQTLRTLVQESGGAMVDEAIIPAIAYHGALIDIPVSEIQGLIERRAIRLALADDVMFLRPQSLLLSPIEDVPTEVDALAAPLVEAPSSELPIAALLDGVPVPAHALLDNRLILDDPDDLQSRAIVSRRGHATAMASLILHGDLNSGEPPLSRPLYVRPLMYAPEFGNETTDENHLLVDTIYRAVLRMKGSEGEVPVAPTVFLVNLSMGDPRRPFTRSMSPLARLLDFLSYQYGMLFLVSGGNVAAPLTVPGFDDWTSFEQAAPNDRERAVITALNQSKHERSLLSPAESINGLTIGAHHHDNVDPRSPAPNAVDPFIDALLPNVSSALGLGYRRAVKPELYFPGGREYVGMKSFGDGLEISVRPGLSLFGVKAAAPDPTGLAGNFMALTNGTSAATALATRAAHQIFDALMDEAGESLLCDMDPAFYAVVVKTLLVHRARWPEQAEKIKDLCGPADRRRHVERSENASRFLGFGAPNVREACECASNRATLVGFGAVLPDQAHLYKIPLPPSLERVTDPRSLTISLAWFSPVKPGHQSYRGAKLGVDFQPRLPQVLGVERGKIAQPADPTTQRGTVFHEHFSGDKAVPFVDDGHLALRVWCREDAGGVEAPIRYGIAVTIEAETHIPVYDEIQNLLRVRPRP